MNLMHLSCFAFTLSLSRNVRLFSGLGSNVGFNLYVHSGESEAYLEQFFSINKQVNRLPFIAWWFLALKRLKVTKLGSFELQNWNVRLFSGLGSNVGFNLYVHSGESEAYLEQFFSINKQVNRLPFIAWWFLALKSPPLPPSTQGFFFGSFPF